MFWRQNRFGQEELVLAIRDKKKNGFPYGYVNIGGKVYKVFVNNANKDGVSYWVKFVKTNFRPRNY